MPCLTRRPGPWGSPSAGRSPRGSRGTRAPLRRGLHFPPRPPPPALPRSPLPGKLFRSDWAFWAQKARHERAAAADPAVRKMKQVRQLTRAGISFYLAIFGLVHFFFLFIFFGPFQQLVLFQKRDWVAHFQMFSALRFLCSPPLCAMSSSRGSPAFPGVPAGFTGTKQSSWSEGQAGQGGMGCPVGCVQVSSRVVASGGFAFHLVIVLL